ncbi:glycosyltransferase family 39 protein [Aquisphaera insulae]|uniref:glycosyltransferase family 39 protein n=1 Tax=Aquisphaera insulae TaxID=2712864 RepID=UPI0013EC1C8F|nr:glycosyltransferase family 39 protein [Aquisphaera insulae]
MAGRRPLFAIILVAAGLHALAIARSPLPAQDGLKFIRVARQFQVDSWPDAVRGADVHPLYPALIAATEPVVSRMIGHGPDAWRISAQVVAAIASLGLLVPIYGLTRRLFDERIALMAAAILALLPVPAEVGHDTLSDSLGLLATLATLRFGAVAIRTRAWQPALAAGLAGGIGYLARPEVVVAPMAVALAWVVATLRGISRGDEAADEPHWGSAGASPSRMWTHVTGLPALAISTLALVGSYALVKGQVSEKLALRYGAAIGSQAIVHRPVPQLLPRGLKEADLDFSAKEEGERTTIRGPRKAISMALTEWWDELCWGFAVMTLWGLARQRFVLGLCRRADDDGTTGPRGGPERLVLGVFAAVFLVVLVRHATSLGYLSGRHMLPIVAVSVPWAAAGTFVCLRGLGRVLRLRPGLARGACVAAVAAVVTVLAVYQVRPGHPTRRGHLAAGRWLQAHAEPGEAVLDTRGWARFVSGSNGYDYWHVRQALTDSHLRYVVVGVEELAAQTPRARTLSSLLAYAATPLIEFPVFSGSKDVGVRIYRFQQPGSWEGLTP